MAGAAFGVYTWQHHKVASLTSEKTALSPNIPVSTTDDNFVTIAPGSSFLAGPGDTTFSWTPHKDATYYVLEYRVQGQSAYPGNPASDQYVRIQADQTQPRAITLTKNFSPQVPTTYIWRVSARKTVNNQEVILQTTAENSLTVE